MANRAERRRMMRQQEAQNKKRGTDAKDPAIMAKIDAWEKNGGASTGAAYSGMMAEKDQKMRIKLAVREQVRKIIEHNGITEDDLEEEWEKGRQFGFKQAAEPIIKCCYAGICLALHDEFGFGESRCFRAIQAVDRRVIWALNHTELVEEVLEKTGLELQLDEPFDRVQQKEKRRA